MATPHFFVNYSILDAKGERSTTTINFPDNNDFDTIIAFAGSTAGLIDPLIRGAIVDIGVGLTIDFSTITGIKAAPLANSDVEEGAKFSFGTVAGSETGFRLASFDETFIVPATKVVDTANGTVDAFVDRITAGQTVGLINVSPSDTRGEDITVLKSARESFQSSR